MGLNDIINRAQKAQVGGGAFQTSRRAPVNQSDFSPERLERELRESNGSRQGRAARTKGAPVLSLTGTTVEILDRVIDAIEITINEDFEGFDDFESCLFGIMNDVICNYNQAAEKNQWETCLKPGEYEMVAIFGILGKMRNAQKTKHRQADIGWVDYLENAWRHGFSALKIATGNSSYTTGKQFERSVETFRDKVISERDDIQAYSAVATIDDDIAANERIASQMESTKSPAFYSILGNDRFVGGMREYLIKKLSY